MVARNYDIGSSDISETVSNNGSNDSVTKDYRRSSRGTGSQTSGTVRHGRFQYLGDRPFEVTDSLKGYNNRDSEVVNWFLIILKWDDLKVQIDLLFIWLHLFAIEQEIGFR
ncbi:hypothetical protein C0J52_11039 [Blattella germanica]|nr:hypothetical protein C0J52_11039 [Blattella germanica]